jgi:hypothetical protein
MLPHIRLLDSLSLKEAQGVNAVAGLRVQLDMLSLPTSNGRPLRAKLARWYCGGVLQVLITVLCNLPRRMADSIEICGWLRRGCTGKIPARWDRSEVRQPETLRRDYIRYMQQLDICHPRLLLVDLHLVSQAWKDGSVTGARFCSGQTQIEMSSASPEADSMPHPQAQQESICGLLTLLPSQALRDELARRERSCTTQNKESQPLSGSPVSLNTHSSNV